MVNIHIFSLSLLLSLPLPLAQRIETAFLQNSPALLGELLTDEGAIPVSLPEPLGLADQLSPDQTTLVFRRIFSVFRTTEFTTEPRLSAMPGVAGGILKARWSFRNDRTGNRYPFRVYFFIAPMRRGLRIVEIRAERL